MEQAGLIKVHWFYRKIVNSEFVAALVAGAGVVVRDGVYRHAVVIWLMIMQRLSYTGTLTDAVEALRACACGDLLSVRGRKRIGDLSAATGGYARARARLQRGSSNWRKIFCRLFLKTPWLWQTGFTAHFISATRYLSGENRLSCVYPRNVPIASAVN